MPDVPVAIRNRAYVPFCQTAPGLERQSVHRSGEYPALDVVVRPDVLATVAHAG